MSLKEEAERRIAGLIKRWDDFNCSLADRALPDNRRRTVSELSLQDKALKAGQKAVKKRAKKTPNKS
ncbi:hypothetical protein [Marinobacter sp. CHS3-4]|uniref:hypothetical protein n=1 Tax=Marinobacter sp. CHS3-4 TaxID=3045174 RepID=UPI0024B60B42|nr:hypothetical protein [Marinobacter sp. CHS3-4]MDI9245040.1 hypothetical protein [Marinobacter sp. CHS3-4]